MALVQTDTICSQCRASDVPRSGRFGDRPLGTLAATRLRTSCPCCRLVVAAHDQYQGPGYRHTDDEEIGLRWDGGSFQFIGGLSGAKLSVVQGNEASKVRNAREVREGFVDTTLAKKWLWNCTTHHGDDCASPVNKVGDGGLRCFRVIDVKDLCLVEIGSENKYVALSYVWGLVRTVRLGRGNLISLMQRGGLAPVIHELPRTIQDAITLVGRIDERYLWVDTLCLVQDDPDDMSDGIQNMDLIYEGAYLTIIAAAGRDANVGLPGITVRRPAVQNIEELKPGVKVVVLHDIDHHLGVSKYASRGWT